MRRNNELKNRLTRNETVIGTWLTIPSPEVANVIAAGGFDFVIVDMEHGPTSFETAEDIVRAVESENRTPLIRVPNNDDALILRALEIGAHGVVIPQISSQIEAERAVASAKYFPLGKRGFSPYTRSAGYSSKQAKEIAHRENERTMVVILVEGIEGISNLAQIIQTEGIDVVYLGIYDITQAAGHPGDVGHPVVQKLISGCIQQIIGAGISVGCLSENLASLKQWVNLGVNFIAYQADCSLIMNACEEVVRGMDE